MDEVRYKARILRVGLGALREALSPALTGRYARWNFRPGFGMPKL